MTTIVHALTPVAHSTQARSVHNNAMSGIDATSWPGEGAPTADPHAITIGRLLNWDEGLFDDRGGIIVRRGAVFFDINQAFDRYTRVTGLPRPATWQFSRSTLSFNFASAGIEWRANGEVGSVARYGSQLNRLFYSSTTDLFAPSKAGASATVPPFDPRNQKTPATVKTSELEHLRIEPKSPVTSGPPRISVPLVFVSKVKGYHYEVGPGSSVDGTYRIDLTGRIGNADRFAIILAGSPAGESLADPDMDVYDFGAATYFNFFLNVKIEF